MGKAWPPGDRNLVAEGWGRRVENMHKERGQFFWRKPILGFEFRAWLVLGGHSTTWVMPQSFFFQLGSSIFAQASLDYNPIYASCTAEMTRMNHYSHLIGWDRVSLTFCLGWPWTGILLSTNSCIAGITDMSKLIGLNSFFELTDTTTPQVTFVVWV
jgi:hypothetical protein